MTHEQPAKSGRLRSKQIKAFLWMAAAINGCIALSAWLGVPDSIAEYAIWFLGSGGLACIGGQFSVDGIAKFRGAPDDPA